VQNRKRTGPGKESFHKSGLNWKKGRDPSLVRGWECWLYSRGVKNVFGTVKHGAEGGRNCDGDWGGAGPTTSSKKNKRVYRGSKEVEVGGGRSFGSLQLFVTAGEER